MTISTISSHVFLLCVFPALLELILSTTNRASNQRIQFQRLRILLQVSTLTFLTGYSIPFYTFVNMTEIPLLIFLIIPVVTWMFFAILSIFYISYRRVVNKLRERARAISIIVVDVSPTIASLPIRSPHDDNDSSLVDADISLRSHLGEKVKRRWSLFPFPWKRRTAAVGTVNSDDNDAPASPRSPAPTLARRTSLANHVLMRCFGADPQVLVTTKVPPGSPLTENACSVCLEDFAEGDTITVPSAETSCSHSFHPECITQWLKQSDSATCPVCRDDYIGQRKEWLVRRRSQQSQTQQTQTSPERQSRSSPLEIEHGGGGGGREEDVMNVVRDLALTEFSVAMAQDPLVLEEEETEGGGKEDDEEEEEEGRNISGEIVEEMIQELSLDGVV